MSESEQQYWPEPLQNTQERIVELILEGKFPGENTIPKHVETPVGHIFIFEERVYKFYKNDTKFFNEEFRDISQKEERFLFTGKDFEWNKMVSPDVYLDMVGVVVDNNELKLGPLDASSEEAVIVMNRLSTENILFRKLFNHEVTENDSFEIGQQFGKALSKVQKDPIEGQSFYDLFGDRIKNIRGWLNLVSDFVSSEEAQSYCDYLEGVREANKDWFNQELSEEITLDGDFHSQNAVYYNKKLYLMDTYPPKEEWQIGHRMIPVYQVGSDIWALSGNKELFESYLRGYEDGSSLDIDRKLADVFIIYAASIAVFALYEQQRKDKDMTGPAEQYHAFLRNYFGTLDLEKRSS